MSYATPAELRMAMETGHFERMLPDIGDGEQNAYAQRLLDAAAGRLDAGLRAAGYSTPIDLTSIPSGPEKDACAALLRQRNIDGAIFEMAPALASTASSLGAPSGEAGDRLGAWLSDLMGSPGTDGWGRSIRTAFRASLPGVERRQGWV